MYPGIEALDLDFRPLDLRKLDDFLQHLLEAVGAGGDGAQLFALVHRGRDRGIEKEHEFHEDLRRFYVAAGRSRATVVVVRGLKSPHRPVDRE